jgi:hypothetical protein
MIVRCGMGLGNRVAAIANGLSRAAEIRFVWRVNRHCPAAHSDVFPQGIPGVEFVTDAPPNFATKFDGVWCYEWAAAGDRQRADSAYAEIMRAMAGNPMPDPPEVAILGRFYRNPSADPITLADAAIRLHGRYRWDRAFVLADMHRAAIDARLRVAGFEAVQPSCGTLAADLHRTREDVLAYAGDWHTLLAARHIIALDGPASALHPARAAGVPITYA